MATKKIINNDPKPTPLKDVRLPYEIDVYQLLLHSRQLSLVGEVTEKKIEPLIQKLMALQLISDDPIVIWINSPGGSLADGFSLIDTMRMSKVPIYTVIRGWACSMAGLISVSGHKRFMTENSQWMAHDVTAGGYDYADKIVARAKVIEGWQTQAFSYLRENTHLSEADLTKARTQELWLSPAQCLEKGIVDSVFQLERAKK